MDSDQASPSSHLASPLPPPFKLTLNMYTQARWYGEGVISIVPGEIVVKATRGTQAETVTYRGSEVEIQVARLLPPWCNVSVPVSGDGGDVRVYGSIFLRKRLRRLFQECGFDIRERRVWFTSKF